MNLDNVKSSGMIGADDGLRIPFESSAVLAYDVKKLAVGQTVTFDIQHGNDRTACNVSVEWLHAAPARIARRDSDPPRYLGFQQRGNARLYRFEHVLKVERSSTPHTVIADMALFTRHHVGLQEGPALCLRLLVIALGTGEMGATSLPTQTLTDGDMLTFLADRPSKIGRR